MYVIQHKESGQDLHSFGIYSLAEVILFRKCGVQYVIPCNTLSVLIVHYVFAMPFAIEITDTEYELTSLKHD